MVYVSQKYCAFATLSTGGLAVMFGTSEHARMAERQDKSHEIEKIAA